jgi:hypothetical protein
MPKFLNLFGCILLFTCAGMSCKSLLKPARIYELNVQGFRVIANVDSLEHPEITTALRVIDSKLYQFRSILPEKQFRALQGVPIWIEWNAYEQGAARYVESRWQCFQERVAFEKAGGIEIYNLRNFFDWQEHSQPYALMHELAHAYHHRVLGSKNKDVINAYKHAVQFRKYEMVANGTAGIDRAYALTNADEYFAELSEAYLGKNDFYPFNRSQLMTYDSVGYELMKKIWE